MNYEQFLYNINAFNSPSAVFSRGGLKCNAIVFTSFKIQVWLFQVVGYAYISDEEKLILAPVMKELVHSLDNIWILPLWPKVAKKIKMLKYNHITHL